MSNNAAESGLRGVALGRRIVVILAVSDRGRPTRRSHVKPHRHRQEMNGSIRRRAATTLKRLAASAHRLDELLPWNNGERRL